MKRLSLYYTLGLVALLLGVYSCKKVNGINNNTVVETPYSLYFSDTSGTIFVSTDGVTIDHIVFPPDAKPTRSIVTSGNNILFAKNNLYYSTNNGQNFNLTYDSLSSINLFNNFTAGLPLPISYAVNGLPIDLNQSMLYNVSSWGNRVYASSYSQNINNYVGLVFSDQNGDYATWNVDASYDTNAIGAPPTVGILPVRMTSLTQLANGYLCGIAYEPTGVITATTLANHIRYVRNFYKSAKSGAISTNWREVTSNPDNVVSIFQGSVGSGNPLPPRLGTPDTSFFTLGHYNNRLIAIDQKGEYGAWYSDDFGANWTQYTGLPANVPLLCISAPFEEVCLIGTDSAGLYILNANTGTWQQNNNGVTKNLIVRNIAFKETIYKNGTVSKYIYLATNKGIFQSTDGGHNWIMTIAGNYVGVY